MKVYAIPTDGTAPFLMFIADMGEASAHKNAHRTRRLYTQEIAAYEFRGADGHRRFEFLDAEKIAVAERDANTVGYY